jgi:hypothetical protein
MQTVTKNFVSCKNLSYQEDKEKQINLKNNEHCRG